MDEIIVENQNSNLNMMNRSVYDDMTIKNKQKKRIFNAYENLKLMFLNIILNLYIINNPNVVLGSYHNRVFWIIIALISIFIFLLYIICSRKIMKRRQNIFMWFVLYIQFTNIFYFIFYFIFLIFNNSGLNFLKFIFSDILWEPKFNENIYFCLSTTVTFVILLYFYISSFLKFNSIFKFKIKAALDCFLIVLFYFSNCFLVEMYSQRIVLKTSILIIYRISNKVLWLDKMIEEIKIKKNRSIFDKFAFVDYNYNNKILYDVPHFISALFVLCIEWLNENVTQKRLDSYNEQFDN